MKSKTSHFESLAHSRTADNDDIEKYIELVLRNILNQKKHKRAKDYLLYTNEGEKLQN